MSATTHGSIPSGGDALDMRVVSCNVRNGRSPDGLNAWPLRRHRLAEELRALDADVIGVQEAYVWQLEYLREHLAGFAYVGRGRRDGGRQGEHCAILASARFELRHEATMWFGAQPHVPGSKLPGSAHPRIATFARLRDRSLDMAFEVVNLHLDHRSQANRERSIAQLVDHLHEPVPRVVLGDFNAGPTNPVLDSMAAAGYTSALPSDAGATAHGYRGAVDGPQIDHILVSRHWRVLDARVVRSTLGQRRHVSDHWPIVADLRLDG
jgi:endonuclease/exonuclease/phosphatase family metal-dependent hydrolase